MSLGSVLQRITPIDDRLDLSVLDQVFEVYQILNHRTKDGVNQYKVWWKGYKKTRASWTNKQDIHATEAIQDYHRLNAL